MELNEASINNKLNEFLSKRNQPYKELEHLVRAIMPIVRQLPKHVREKYRTLYQRYNNRRYYHRLNDNEKKQQINLHQNGKVSSEKSRSKTQSEQQGNPTLKIMSSRLQNLVHSGKMDLKTAAKYYKNYCSKYCQQ